MERHRILFVDDEPMILRVLTREMRAYTDRWDVFLANDGREAIIQLGTQDIDILVTDMVMPGVDGSALLKHTRDNHPAIVRILLSGYTDFNHAVRSVPFAHQRIVKPWQADELINTLDRASQLRALIGRDAIRRTTSEVSALPSSPESYVKLSRELDSPNATFASVAAIVETDVAMSAKVLQLANSAFVGARHPIGELTEAVRMVGLREMREYALTPFLDVFRVSDHMMAATKAGVSSLGKHAHVTAHLAAEVAKLTTTARRQEGFAALAFTTGLLHDIGKLLLWDRERVLMEEIEQEAKQKKCVVEDVERRRLGVTHAEVGAYLLGLWGLPPEVCQATQNHHSPHSGAPLDDVLWVANWLASEHLAQEREGVRHNDVLALDVEFHALERLGFTRRIPELLQLAERVNERGVQALSA